MASIIDDIANSYSSRVGMTSADIKRYSGVGIPNEFRQPTPSGNSSMGFTGTDVTVSSNISADVGTQPAAVSILNFKKPMIRRTNPNLVTVTTGIFGAFAGYNANRPNWMRTDNFDTKTTERSGSIGTGLNTPFDAIRLLVSKTQGDIGQRMIPDAAQSFNWFAGGLLRAIKGRPVRVMDWKAGLSKEYGDLTPLKTFWIEQTLPWLENSDDVITMPISRKLFGQGWNAFQGNPQKIGGDLPRKGNLFATAGGL